MKIFITGLNSFLGQNLFSTLQKAGHSVSGTTRSGKFGNLTCFKWSLSEPSSPKWFNEVDAIVHVAWDMSEEHTDQNIRGTIGLAKIAAAIGVKHQIFVSSCSAHPFAVSQYGIGKRDCEPFFLKNGFIVIRPGLILGSGGAFNTILNLVKTKKIIPVLDSGTQEVPIIAISDLCQVILKLIEQWPEQQEYNLLYPRSPSFKELVVKTGSVLRKKIICVPISSRIVLYAIAIFKTLKIPFPISKEQILGYRANKKFQFQPTIVNNLTYDRTVTEALDIALEKGPNE